jgi:hypothetical protein
MYNGVGYIIPIIGFSLIYNLVKFFEIETIYIEGEVRFTTVTDPDPNLLYRVCLSGAEIRISR